MCTGSYARVARDLTIDDLLVDGPQAVDVHVHSLLTVAL
jgi:hypothetical protein